MNADLDFHIRRQYTWLNLPQNIKQQLGLDQREYDKAIFKYSIKNQLRYKDNLVHKVFRGEKRYYDELLKFSRQRLMLYPYHLQDVMIKGLRTTPFAYYLDILQDIMAAEKSYDCLPNFTAADCLRLLGVGRNQYIELMNQTRGGRKLFAGIGLGMGLGLPRRRTNLRELLPLRPVDSVSMDTWWCVEVGWVTEEDMKGAGTAEKKMIDFLIDTPGRHRAGPLDYGVLKTLYQKGLVYLEVPIDSADYIVVPTLEGFVMNRVTGDYLETLLYKIFVSIDEHTSVEELATVLQIDLQQVKNAISMFCRLGFAYKKPPTTTTAAGDLAEADHPSWKAVTGGGGGSGGKGGNKARTTASSVAGGSEGLTLIDWSKIEDDLDPDGGIPIDLEVSNDDDGVYTAGSHLPESASCMSGLSLTSAVSTGRKLALLFDSTLTAYLMMGNLSPGLKNHAVTMFEVGKLSDESIDNFLSELDRVVDVGEGEARRYFEHAVNLRDTIRRLRHNEHLLDEEGCQFGLDLLRCASLLSLDPSTRARILTKNYRLVISMAPISLEDRTVTSCRPLHLGPPIPEVNSVWFKLFLYHATGSGPPSLLLARGTRLTRLPSPFLDCDRLLITTWNHDAALAPASNILLCVNEALNHNPVLLQAYDSGHQPVGKHYVTFPAPPGESLASSSSPEAAIIARLGQELDLDSTCGFVTLLYPHSSFSCGGTSNAAGCGEQVTLLDVHFGIPLFSSQLNQRICASLASRQLLSEDNHMALTRANRALVLRLLTFIDQVNGGGGSGSRDAARDAEVPLPTRSLLFYRGTLSQL